MTAVRGGLGATYRLQLNGLGLRRAATLVPYLHALGVDTLYASPLTTAAPGSTHGYDVVDPTRLDPALGTEEDLEALLAALDAHGMRLLVDIVPNHMAASQHNAWWVDVLRRGQGSPYARFFDIDWRAGGDKVVLPVLGRPLGEALAAGELVVEAAPGGAPGHGEPVLRYADRVFPLAPGTADDGPGPPGTGGDGTGGRAGGSGTAALEAVLDAQHYRLVHWRAGPCEVNYRRFFDIDGLVGVRVEDPDVYARTHHLALELARDRRVAGVRVDHVDGLANPAQYLERLRADLDATVVVVEKILARHETLPDWPVEGTTGYEFADLAMGVMVDGPGVAAMAGPGAEPFATTALAARREVLARSFPGQWGRLSAGFAEAVALEAGPGVTTDAVKRVVGELTCQLRVYRTYIAGPDPAERDRRRIGEAAAAARDALAGDEEARHALDAILGMRVSEALVTTWQQLTSAVAAKGVEDTALYRFSGLLAAADVGSDPGDFPVTVGEFHERMGERARRWPGALNATSSHDAKRSEDVRARLAALSEIPHHWAALGAQWQEHHAELGRQAFGGGGVPADVEATLYQTVAGAWPLGPRRLDELAARVGDAAAKAAREAKLHTSWTDPDPAFETGLEQFVAGVLDPSNRAFVGAMDRLLDDIGPAGAVNALSLVVLKATAPGVPDLYQGSELWNPLLVDPDNRRPVDFERRIEAMDRLERAGDVSASASAVLDRWRDGEVKMLVTRAALSARRAAPELFGTGAYVPLEAAGRHRHHVVAFARRSGRRWAVAIVPRLVRSLAGPGRMPVGGDVWGDTRVSVPAGAPDHLTDALAGTGVEVAAAPGEGRRAIAVGSALATLPVAVLTGTGPGADGR
jgi:(1->4)-alpha-D-glucan 1-alpha-D-glucosylmutase